MFEKSHITKEEIAQIKPGKFEGTIVLIETVKAANEALKEINQFDYCGIDTETKPAFRKGERHPVALLQISIPNNVTYLFWIAKIGIPKALISFLEDPHFYKFGIAIKDDVKELVEKEFHKPQSFVELALLTKDLGIVNAGLRGLAALLLGIRISKTQQRSNWGAEMLTNAQQLYAATDAWVCLRLFEFLDDRDQIPNNLEPFIIC